jgi:predicted RNA-binding protein associated with RNAse of E/G family
MSFYADKVDAENRATIAEDALGKAVKDTNATKASYKTALDNIEKIRKEAEHEKCNLKTLRGGTHHFPI